MFSKFPAFSKLRIVLYLGLTIAITGLIAVYISSQSKSVKPVMNTSTMKTQTSSGKTYEHTFPEQVTKSDFFQGTFMQNDVAGIYPRREALVKDILVDIGDKVKEGQTLAILFEPGVSGQAGSNIGLKSTIVNAQTKILADTKKVSGAKISEFDATIAEAQTKIQEVQAQISEKEILLSETLNNYDVKISQAKNVYDTQTESLSNTLEVEEKVLLTLEVSLENAKNTKAEKLFEAKTNISQKETLLNSKIDEVYTGLLPLVYIGEENSVDYNNTRRGDLSQFFSARNSGVKSDLVLEIQKFQNERYTLDTFSKYELLLSINRLLVLGLENTLFSLGDTDEATVKSYISRAKIYETSLISQKEIYDDTVSSLGVLESGETEKVSSIEQKIEEQKVEIQRVQADNELFITDSSVELTESEKKLQAQKLKSEIEVLKAGLQTLQSGLQRLTKTKGVIVANENKQITTAANNVATAKADLNKEYVASGDYKIISPFSGVISKRDVEIGAMISPKSEAFRVAGVDNSLSRITKKEIKFFIPENLQDQIGIDQEVYFSTANESQSFTGTVYRISPEIDPDTRSITIQAKVDDSIELSNKSSIRVTLKSETLTYRVPTSSIYNKDERNVMYYKKDNGKLGVQDITILSDDGEYSLVSGDFDATLKVVTTPIFVK